MPTTPIAATFHATAARDAAAVECLDLIARLESAVRAHVAQPATWGLHANLTESRTRLAELAEFLGA